jgi:spermidine dehydrogenase
MGAGSMLLRGCGREEAQPVATEARLRHSENIAWDGPSGIGEYAGSNGNTWRTMQAGHHIRDATYEGEDGVRDIAERVDLVVVGAGFAGLGAMDAFRRERPDGTCLVLDNQEIFGGYAKANRFEVDGYRIEGAQASLNFVVPEGPQDRAGDLWQDLGLPFAFDFAEREDADRRMIFSASSSGPLYAGEQSASTGYFFGADGWVGDIWRDDLQRAPFSSGTREALLRLRERRRAGPFSEAEAKRLDAITFEDFAIGELEATLEAVSFITEGMCITGPKISAYAAKALPGLERYPEGSPGASFGERFVSFPSGNTVLARGLVSLALPEAFAKESAAEGYGALRFDELDDSRNRVRIRQRATVLEVANLSGGGVAVTYLRDGKRYRVMADACVLAVGAWVARRIVRDLPAAHEAALAAYHYAPILMANVALRQWRFLDRIGFSAARWFDGEVGFYANVRKPMMWGGERLAPFHPDKPIVLTLYAPFAEPSLPLEVQGPVARQRLFQTSYAEYESAIIRQLELMFAPAGFVAERDIAGIVLNRWGHAFVMPPPGFFFGGEIPPANIVDHPFGSIAFGQNGLQDWFGAVEGGRRAVRQVLSS